MNKDLGLDKFDPVLIAAQGIKKEDQDATKSRFKVFNPSAVLKISNIITFELSNRFDSCRTVYHEVKTKC